MIFSRAVGKKKAIALHCKQDYANSFLLSAKCRRQLLMRLIHEDSFGIFFQIRTNALRGKLQYCT